MFLGSSSRAIGLRMRFKTALGWILWLGFCSLLCAGLFAGCLHDPNFGWPQLGAPGATPAEKTAYERNQATQFNPFPDPSLSHTDPGETPLGFNEPRDITPYLQERRAEADSAYLQPGAGPARAAQASPIVIVPDPGAPPATVTAPYPSNSPYVAPTPFAAPTPSPYPGAAPTPMPAPNATPMPGPSPTIWPQ